MGLALPMQWLEVEAPYSRLLITLELVTALSTTSPHPSGGLALQLVGWDSTYRRKEKSKKKHKKPLNVLGYTVLLIQQYKTKL